MPRVYDAASGQEARTRPRTEFYYFGHPSLVEGEHVKQKDVLRIGSVISGKTWCMLCFACLAILYKVCESKEANESERNGVEGVQPHTQSLHASDA